jgi:hypothetical protein
MKKTRRSKTKPIRDNEIDTFCQGVKDILSKINERCDGKKNRKKTGQESLTCVR